MPRSHSAPVPKPSRRWIGPALLLLALALAAVGAGRWAWVDPLSVIPSLVWTTLALALLLWTLLARDWLAAALATAGLVISGSWLGIVNGPPPTVTGKQSAVRVVAWNIYGWDDESEDRLEFLQFIREWRPELVLLQEAWLDDPAVVEDLRATWPAAEIANYKEWTVVSAFPVVEKSVPPPGGFFHVRVRIDGRPVDVFNVHVDTVWGPARFERRRRQFEALQAAVAAAPAAIVAGDFNTPWHHPWIRELREDWTVGNPVGLSLPLTMPSLLPIARIDYLFGSPEVTFSDYDILVHLRQLMGHRGLFAICHLPEREQGDE